MLLLQKGKEETGNKEVFKNMFSEQRMQVPDLRMDISGDEFHLLKVFRHLEKWTRFGPLQK